MTSLRLEAAEMRFLRNVAGYTRLDKIRSEVNNNNNNNNNNNMFILLCAVLQIGRSLVRSQLVSVGFPLT